MAIDNKEVYEDDDISKERNSNKANRQRITDYIGKFISGHPSTRDKKETKIGWYPGKFLQKALGFIGQNIKGKDVFDNWSQDIEDWGESWYKRKQNIKEDEFQWKERNPEETDIMISDEPPVNFEYPTYDAGGRVEEKVIDWDDMENNR